ncbi:MAG: LysR family transcriptional regulator [Minwuiales bacterium]|nr:LysR family transcriptional regulator [Minwuiales bacterium]
MELKILYRIGVFRRVVEAGSFTRAADDLGLSKSVVSQYVTDLERRLNVRLLNRSTRSVSVTQEGHQLAEAAGTMLDAVGTALERLETQQESPTGLIRITASQNLAVTYLTGAIARFCDRFPDISVEIDANDLIENIIESGYDLAFRIGWLKETELHAVRICDFEMIPCAAPSFLKQGGRVRSPYDLAYRPWVALTNFSDFDRLSLTSNGGDSVSVRIDAAFRTNSGLTAKQFVAEGAAAGLLPDYAVRNELERGEIVRLLPEWTHRPGAISATYVHRRRMPPRLRAFIDHLKKDAGAYFRR